MARPQLQPNGLYNPRELEAYIDKCVINTLFVSLMLNAVGLIVVTHLIENRNKKSK